MSLRSKKHVTICRAIPAFIPRKLALDVLHDHSEVITLNPLVLSHRQISPPPHAPPDEARSIWYEITERIQFIPGIGKAGSSTINFNGVFHDVPWGLQTHIYAPMSIDMRAQYRIAGSQPGMEAAAPLELGLEQLGAPKEGLYLRADIEFKCNIALASFVKSTSVTAIGEMVSRMVKKAEQMDADILQKMIKEERSDIISRTQSKEQDTWQGQTPSHAQTYPENGHEIFGRPLGQGRSEVQELESPDVYANRKQQHQYQPQAQQGSYPDQQPQKQSYASPTVVAELDGGHSATLDHSNWSKSTLANNNTPYPQAGPPPQSQSLSWGGGREYDQGSPFQQPHYAQHQQYPVQPLYPAQHNYQSEEPSRNLPSMGGHQQQQAQAPQFQSERKYSFDGNRLQPETLNGGADGRRWSAHYTRP